MGALNRAYGPHGGHGHEETMGPQASGLSLSILLAEQLLGAVISMTFDSFLFFTDINI